MYTAYMNEIYGREVIVSDEGFVTYSPKDKEGSVVIHSIYVDKAYRRKGCTAKLEQLVIDKEQPSFLLGYVDITSSTPERSIVGLIKSGYLMTNLNNEIIYFGKEV